MKRHCQFQAPQNTSQSNNNNGTFTRNCKKIFAQKFLTKQNPINNNYCWLEQKIKK